MTETLRYWRCRLLGWTDGLLWPLTGHLIQINLERAYCKRCPWAESLDWLDTDARS